MPFCIFDIQALSRGIISKLLLSCKKIVGLVLGKGYLVTKMPGKWIFRESRKSICSFDITCCTVNYWVLGDFWKRAFCQLYVSYETLIIFLPRVTHFDQWLKLCQSSTPAKCSRLARDRLLFISGEGTPAHLGILSVTCWGLYRGKSSWFCFGCRFFPSESSLHVDKYCVAKQRITGDLYCSGVSTELKILIWCCGDQFFLKYFGRSRRSCSDSCFAVICVTTGGRLDFSAWPQIHPPLHWLLIILSNLPKCWNVC